MVLPGLDTGLDTGNREPDGLARSRPGLDTGLDTRSFKSSNKYKDDIK